MPSVLILDDDLAMLHTLSYAASAAGFDVKTAPTTRRAIAEIERSAPDVIAVDLDIVDAGPGLAALRALRKHTAAPAIIVTGWRFFEIAQEGYALGCVGYLVKGEAAGWLDDFAEALRRGLAETTGARWLQSIAAHANGDANGTSPQPRPETWLARIAAVESEIAESEIAMERLRVAAAR